MPISESAKHQIEIVADELNISQRKAIAAAVASFCVMAWTAIAHCAIGAFVFLQLQGLPSEFNFLLERFHMTTLFVIIRLIAPGGLFLILSIIILCITLAFAKERPISSKSCKIDQVRMRHINSMRINASFCALAAFVYSTLATLFNVPPNHEVIGRLPVVATILLSIMAFIAAGFAASTRKIFR